MKISRECLLAYFKRRYREKCEAEVQRIFKERALA